jgi:hypothetical protein
MQPLSYIQMHDFSQKEPKTQYFLKKYFIPQNKRAKRTPPRQAPSSAASFKKQLNKLFQLIP